MMQRTAIGGLRFKLHFYHKPRTSVGPSPFADKQLQHVPGSVIITLLCDIENCIHQFQNRPYIIEVHDQTFPQSEIFFRREKLDYEAP